MEVVGGIIVPREGRSGGLLSQRLCVMENESQQKKRLILTNAELRAIRQILNYAYFENRAQLSSVADKIDKILSK
jgi:hypothetical protein